MFDWLDDAINDSKKWLDKTEDDLSNFQDKIDFTKIKVDEVNDIFSNKENPTLQSQYDKNLMVLGGIVFFVYIASKLK